MFNYLDCPDCKQRINAPQCPQIDKEVKKQELFEQTVIKKAIERAKFEELAKHERIKKPPFNNDV